MKIKTLKNGAACVLGDQTHLPDESGEKGIEIVLFEKLQFAVFRDNQARKIEKGTITISAVNDQNEPITAKIYMNGNVFEVNGSRKIRTDRLGQAMQDLYISYDKKRFLVGQVTIIGDYVRPVMENAHEMLVKTAMAAERATKLTASFEKRMQALERAYNGSDITNLT